MFCDEGVPKSFAEFTVKQLLELLFKVFSDIFQSHYFILQLEVTASKICTGKNFDFSQFLNNHIISKYHKSI